MQPMPLNRRIGFQPDILKMFQNFKMDFPAIKIRHDKVWDNPIIQNVQVIGRGQREPVNNLCKEIPINIAGPHLGLWKGWDFAEKAKPVKALSLKALQDACKAAGGPKAGIGYGHPAHKGFFAGRAKNRLRGDWIKPGRELPRLVRPDFHFDDIGPRGVFDVNWVRGFNGFDHIGMMAGGLGVGGFFERAEPLSTTKRLELQADADARRAARVKHAKLKKLSDQIEHDILLDPFIDELTAPRANPCEVIAKWVDHYKMNTEGFYNLRDRMKARLSQVGYDLLGSGYFSSAFRGPDNKVYKVNCNYCGLDAWAGFATLCMINRKCPNLPVIYDIKFADKTYCAKMELLTPIDSDFNWTVRACGESKFKGFEQDCFDSVLTMFNCRDNDAINLMDVVRDAAKQTGGWHDIHRENVMFRVVGDSKTLVMTDPIANGNFNMRTFEKMVEEHNTSEFYRMIAA